MRGDEPGGQHAFRVDVAAGERAWATQCLKLLGGRKDLEAELDGYALRYVLQHALAAQDWGAHPAWPRMHEFGPAMLRCTRRVPCVDPSACWARPQRR